MRPPSPKRQRGRGGLNFNSGFTGPGDLITLPFTVHGCNFLEETKHGTVLSGLVRGSIEDGVEMTSFHGEPCVLIARRGSWSYILSSECSAKWVLL